MKVMLRNFCVRTDDGMSIPQGTTVTSATP